MRAFAGPLPRDAPPLRWDRATLRYVLSYLANLWETDPGLLLVCVATRLVRGVSPAAMLWIWMLTLDAAVELATGRRANARYVWALIALEFALTLGTDLVARWGTVAAGVLGDRFANALSIRLMQHAQTFDLSAFEDPEWLDALERARRESGKRLALLLSLLNIAQDVVGLLAFSLLFAALSGWFFLAIFAVAVPACVGEAHFAAVSHAIFQRRSKERRLLDYLRYLCASSQSVKEVKMFGLAPHVTARFAATADVMACEDRTLATRRARFGALFNIVALAGYYGSYVFVFRRFLAHAITIGMLMFMIRALSRARGSVEQLTAGIADVADEVRGVSDLYACLERPRAFAAAAPAISQVRALRDGFELRDVGFRYPGAARWALRHVTMRLRIGETIALVGPNGAGKTTLINLLLRFYEPTEGRILLDGVDLSKCAPDAVRARIGAVFQDFMRYDLSVRENIGFGDLAAMHDAARLAAAVRTSGSSALVDRLPRGYDQIVGHPFDGGVNLSVGEWQRLALARAFIRDCDVLILDEPTAALDAHAESELFQQITAAGAGRLVLLISHRFSTVRLADRIVVLGAGTVLEDGTHEHLVASGGRYAAMFERQAYRFFGTARRSFILIDAPGHEQYTRNMATGASGADAAIVLVDARHGVMVQTRRHSTICSLMRIRHLIVVVNKIDLVGFGRDPFERVRDECVACARALDFTTIAAIPVCARDGDNVTAHSPRTPWYGGPTLLEYLESLDIERDAVSAPFRLPVQWVNRTNADFRGLAGTVVSGAIACGDRIVVARSGQTSSIARIVTGDGDRAEAQAGDAVTLTLTDEIDASRGDLLASATDRPMVADRFAAHVLWMSSTPLVIEQDYVMRIGTRFVTARVSAVTQSPEVPTFAGPASALAMNEIGLCEVTVASPVAFDPYCENRATGAFILIDRVTHETVGAGLIRGASRRATNVHRQALLVDKAARAARNGHRPAVLWFTGLSGAGKSTIATIVEREMHERGVHTYLLDGDNLRHGLNRDLGFDADDRVENVRRVGEVAKLFVDAGVVVLCALISPSESQGAAEARR